MKQFTFLAILAGSSLLFSSCSEGWTDEHKTAFLQACREDSPGMTQSQKDRFCSCLLEQTMSRYKTITEVVENKDTAALNAARESCKANALGQP
jgi:hypothetical protein